MIEHRASESGDLVVGVGEVSTNTPGRRRCAEPKYTYVEWDTISAQSQCELNAHKKSHVHLSNARVEDNECVHTRVYKCSIYK